MTGLTEETQMAVASDDFISGQFYVDIDDSVSFGQVKLDIVDDITPEVDEVFLVTLTGRSSD